MIFTRLFYSRWRRGETVKEDEQVNLQEPVEPSTPVTSVIEIKKGSETIFVYLQSSSPRVRFLFLMC